MATTRRHELTHEQWERLQLLLPPQKPHTGRPWEAEALGPEAVSALRDYLRDYMYDKHGADIEYWPFQT